MSAPAATATPPASMGTSDLNWVLALNTVFETELSPLTAGRLAELRDQAFAARVVQPQAAFLLAFDQDAAYDSPNFLHFRTLYDQFAYVDRIAVSPDHRRKGLAGALYQDLFALVRAAGHQRVVCEVNSDPPNPGSFAFHKALGFQEVDTAYLDDRGKRVVYLACQIA
ncbi:MAG: GNAT family N-acetyltransferase [Pseudomonadota bacterium]